MPVVLVAALLPATAALGEESAARYEAVFVDGTRIVGDTISGWGEGSEVLRLGDTSLTDVKRPLRWLRDRTLKPWSPSDRDSYIEFVGGDRLAGRITGVGGGDSPHDVAHLLVKPTARLHHPIRGAGSPQYVRVLPDRIERVVLRADSHRRLSPGTVYYLDGRKLGFVSLRWRAESVVLLLKNGSREVEISELSEVHLPRIDPWVAYYRELATLSPSCRSRLVRIETVSGLIATGSDLRSDATWLPQPGTLSRIKRMEGQIERLKTVMKQQRSLCGQIRADCAKQADEHQRRLKAAGKARDKARSDLQKKIDQQARKDSDLLAEKRRKTDKQFASARQTMVKRLEKQKPDRAVAAIKAFDLKQAQQRKTQLQALQAERSKLDQKRRKELADFDARQTQKLRRLETDGRARAKELNTRLVHAESQLKGYVLGIDRSTLQRANAIRSGGSIDTWRQIIQPVWSLDALWTPFRSIISRWSFAPQNVPLCRLHPASTVNPPFIPGRTNRGFDGGLLRSGRRVWGWGFAVHAYSELRFELPKCTNAFRSRIGLDHSVGPGGCARARVYVGPVTGKPAYESPLLIGSNKTVDSGSVALKLPPTGAGQLVLQADPASHKAPPGADPSNIRDKLNWFDPQLELDTSRLQEQVRAQVGPLLAATAGWEIRMDRQGRYVWTSFFYDKGRPEHHSFWPMIEARNKPLKLQRKMTIGPDDKHLAVHLGLPTDIYYKPGTVTLHVGGREIQARKIPVRQIWRDRPTPLVFDLGRDVGETVTLELTQPAGGKPLHWQAINISKVPPPEYRLVDSLEAIGRKDMNVPHGLGQAIQSPSISNAEKLASLEFHQLGAVVNFTPTLKEQKAVDGPVNVMIGRDWTGGDKTFAESSDKFKKLTSLKTLLVTSESKVSSGAIAKLQSQLPKLKVIRLIPRVPSPRQGSYRPTTWLNRTNAPLVIIWIDQKGKLSFSSTPRLAPGQEFKRSCYSGVRYEAHYIRKDADKPLDYLYSQPISTFQMSEGAVWEIKPK